jgi:hypothetical protein
MTAGDRAQRSRLACLLVALVLALGLGGAARSAAGPGDGHPVVAAVAGGQSPQAVLDVHFQPRLAPHPGSAAGPLSALVIALLLGLRRRTPPGRGVVTATGRPACGSRAPPVPVTPA